jgi:ABC-2 type transport system permease protein
MTMLRSVLGKTLWDERRGILVWAIGIVAVGCFYAAFFPAINTPDVAAMMDAMAPELMEALGFTAVGTPAGYLGSTTFGLLGPILTIIFAAWMGIRAVAGDEEAGRLDLLLAHPVARIRVVVERFLALVLAVIAVSSLLFLALLAISGVAELDSIGPANLLAAAVQLAGLGVFFGGLALAIGAATGSRAITAGVVAVVAILSYFGNTLAAQIDGLGWARDVSVFRYYSGGRPLVNGFQAADLAVLLVLAALLVAIGALVFNRRDVAV